MGLLGEMFGSTPEGAQNFKAEVSKEEQVKRATENMLAYKTEKGSDSIIDESSSELSQKQVERADFNELLAQIDKED